ncbi:unnamed protein product [Coffea canephora]|uniref:Nuclear factor related to kappa-B-binding protein second winged helix domain-containing protein n=1 Tax=Coffea canephora TaxID=49390 RepID=A0A068UEU7_COFCA|nr:unnamed protein product [Coffea canephora]
MRNKDFIGRVSHDMLEQEDLDAANVLMDLAKDTGSVDRLLAKAPTNQNRNPKKISASAFDSEFSIIHFLSAVRLVLITPVAEDFTVTHSRRVESDKCINASECVQKKLPSLTIEEIVQRLRSSPGDARIFELKASLKDLVRGALKIFSSTIAPSGVPSWQPLITYHKSSKHWSWIGPIPSLLFRGECACVSPKAWGLRSQTLNKLVECFSEWLRASRDMLQKIWNLPPPPLEFMVHWSSAERFSATRNLKISIATISPSSEQVRAYFRMEEALRYLVPQQSFSYTTVDGKKSSVAPMRRCSGKPSRKARDHFILKPNRPPCFTMLCLVRDAAARLPDGMGTRSDICTLVRDSQFIIEDIDDDQVEHVVSGALDRLHYELDPCIRFDRDSRLWFYMHGDREQEDYEYDGTSSIKIHNKMKLPTLDILTSFLNPALSLLFFLKKKKRKKEIVMHISLLKSHLYNFTKIIAGGETEKKRAVSF